MTDKERKKGNERRAIKQNQVQWWRSPPLPVNTSTFSSSYIVFGMMNLQQKRKKIKVLQICLWSQPSFVLTLSFADCSVTEGTIWEWLKEESLEEKASLFKDRKYFGLLTLCYLSDPHQKILLTHLNLQSHKWQTPRRSVLLWLQTSQLHVFFSFVLDFKVCPCRAAAGWEVSLAPRAPDGDWTRKGGEGGEYSVGGGYGGDGGGDQQFMWRQQDSYQWEEWEVEDGWRTKTKNREK